MAIHPSSWRRIPFATEGALAGYYYTAIEEADRRVERFQEKTLDLRFQPRWKCFQYQSKTPA